MTLNWLDVILLLPILAGLVRGLMRGFITEIIAIVVVILGIIGARLWAPQLAEFLLRSFAWPQGVCEAVAYGVLFIAIAILLSIAARLITKFLSAVHLGWANRLMGGIFGMAKYGIIVLVLVFVLDRTNQSFHYLDSSPVVQSSIIYPAMVKSTHLIYRQITEVPSAISNEQ